jgi:methylglutaconyl-CoA hydratase
VVIAAVRGRALAGGAGLATGCDIVIAEEGARFGYPEVRVGFVPAMVMALLRRQIGEKRAFELVATGRQVPASEALELGLVSRVVRAEDFASAVEQLVSELCAMPAHALRSTKRLFYSLDATNFDDGMAQAVRVNVQARSTAEFREGVRRFAPGKKGS